MALFVTATMIWFATEETYNPKHVKIAQGYTLVEAVGVYGATFGNFSCVRGPTSHPCSLLRSVEVWLGGIDSNFTVSLHRCTVSPL